MKAAIISTGTELLWGETLDTNANFISQQLARLGIDVYWRVTVGDNYRNLVEVLRIALHRADLVITSGGMGPTLDDLTKRAVAEVCGLELVIDHAVEEQIAEFFRQRNRPVPRENAAAQARIPVGAITMPNSVGTAPGIIIRQAEKIIVNLPGPPAETEPMVMQSLIPYLREVCQEHLGVVRFKVLRTCGISESSLEKAIAAVTGEGQNPTVALLAKGLTVDIRLTARAADEAAADALLAAAEREIRAKVDAYIYGEGQETLEEAVGKLCVAQKVTLATAESCTAGLIAGTIANVPGSSAYLERGVVTYSNLAKHELLGVPLVTIEQYGAVSRPTAEAMAQGIRTLARTDLGIAVTGIAGPGGGSAVKPVGLVYIALATPDGVRCEECKFTGDRQGIRTQTVQYALNMIRLYLREKSASIRW